MITTLPYVYEAFRQVYQLNGDQQLLDVMRSIAQHALEDYDDYEVSVDASTCCYSPGPDNSSGVINANAYRSYLLMLAARDFSEERYEKAGLRNLNFVIQSQNLNGSWYYSTDNVRDFVDHFHTCFVLKALGKIEQLTDSVTLRTAIDRGVNYYVANLFDADGLPKPFSKPPRLTVYRHELYDYAECINLGTLLMGRYPELDRVLETTVLDVLKRWQKKDGSFRARKLLVGWDNVPMHRWAQSQLFRSLSFLLAKTASSTKQLESLVVASSEMAK